MCTLETHPFITVCVLTYDVFYGYHLKAGCRKVVVHFSELVTSHNIRCLCHSRKKQKLFVCFLLDCFGKTPFPRL